MFHSRHTRCVKPYGPITTRQLQSSISPDYSPNVYQRETETSPDISSTIEDYIRNVTNTIPSTDTRERVILTSSDQSKPSADPIKIWGGAAVAAALAGGLFLASRAPKK